LLTVTVAVTLRFPPVKFNDLVVDVEGSPARNFTTLFFNELLSSKYPSATLELLQLAIFFFVCSFSFCVNRFSVALAAVFRIPSGILLVFF
jgi:hypothetical protein